MGLDPVQPTSTELDSLLDPSHPTYVSRMISGLNIRLTNPLKGKIPLF